MNRFPSRATVDRVREYYPIGSKVELVSMNDPWTNIPEGTQGTVIGVDDTATVHVKWDCGSSLGAVYGEDVIRRVSV